MFLKYTLMHMYKCILIGVNKSKEGHGSKQFIYFQKNAKNMNNPFTTRVKVATLAYTAQPVAI